MLRLAPSHPPLWRTPDSVQLGIDDERPLTGLHPWQERLLDALVGGIPDARLAPLATELGASVAEAERFLHRIKDALATDASPAPPVRIELPTDLSHDDETSLLTGIRAAGLTIAECARWALPPAGEPVLLVASRLVDPHRAARLTADDIPHLPVELSGDRVVVGPLVAPGASACLACVHAHHRDRDPDWPFVAAQLLARRAVPTDPLLLVEAATLAARLLRSGDAGRSVVLSAGDGRREWREHRPHAACLCRSPEGIATVAAPGAPTAAPTTATAYARPA
jgi:bacteriocin biosynthesis cyclodehydratase domain-containing protein